MAQLIFKAAAAEGKTCSMCKRHTAKFLYYVMVHRSDRTDESHYLICERCIAALERVVTCGVTLRRARGQSTLPGREL